MARLLRELVRSRRQSSNRLIPTITRQNPSILSPQLFFQKQVINETKFDHGFGLNPSNEGLRLKQEITHLSKLQIYPSFSYGFFLDPNLPSGLEGADMEDPGMMWADSVKKKRKKKMNKHKYKKLRKRLRRKTKI